MKLWNLIERGAYRFQMLQFRTKSHKIIFSPTWDVNLRFEFSFSCLKILSSHTRFHVSILNCIVFLFLLLLLPHHTLNSTRSQTPTDGQIPSFSPRKARIANLRGLQRMLSYSISANITSDTRFSPKLLFSLIEMKYYEKSILCTHVRLQCESQLTRTRRVFSDRDFHDEEKFCLSEQKFLSPVDQSATKCAPRTRIHESDVCLDSARLQTKMLIRNTRFNLDVRI